MNKKLTIVHYFKLPFFQLFSLILITAKVFGFSDFSWFMCLAPITFEILILFTLSVLKADDSSGNA